MGVNRCAHPSPFQANSRDITDAVKDRLLELTITDEAGIKSDQLKLTLDDRRSKNGAVAALPSHRHDTRRVPRLRRNRPARHGLVSGGQSNCAIPRRRFQSGPGPPTWAGRSAAAKPGPGKPPHGAMVNVIASEHGYEAKVDSELSGIAVPHLDQVSESGHGAAHPDRGEA